MQTEAGYAQKLFREKLLMGITGATALALVGLSFVSLPALHALAEPK
jgi:hypothetical protein